MQKALKYILYASFVGGIVILIALFYEKHESSSQKTATFQAFFSNLEKEQTKKLLTVEKDWSKLNTNVFREKYIVENNWYIHVFHEDSLVFWNTNKLPIFQFKELHFPLSGLFRAQNGWYFTKFKEQNGFTVCLTFPIQRTFPYQNSKLKDYFFSPFPNVNASIDLERGENQIKDQKNTFLFQLQFLENLKQANSTSSFLFIGTLFLLSLSYIFVQRKTSNFKFKTLTLVLFSALLYFLFVSDKNYLFGNSDLLESSNLALNDQIVNLADLILVTLFACALLSFITELYAERKRNLFGLLVGITLIASLLFFLPKIGISIIENTRISLYINDLVSLSLNSVVLLFLLGFVAFCFVHFCTTFWYCIFDQNECLTFKWHYFSSILICFGILTLVFWTELELHYFWIFVLFFWSVYVSWKKLGNWNFPRILVAISIFSLGITASLSHDLKLKEREERVLYANQLIDDKDITSELEYVNLKETILKDNFFVQIFDTLNPPNFSETKIVLERRLFSNYWERFDIDVYYFEPEVLSEMNGYTQKDFEHLIEFHSQFSEIDSSLFSITENTVDFTYLFRVAFKNGTEKRLVYGTLKSKKIPEKIGFPRLLISESANSFDWLENYSIAKYVNKKLTTTYGQFNYKTILPSGFIQSESSAWQKENGYEHYVLRGNDNATLLLTRKLLTNWETVTSFAFLVFGYGIVLFLFYLIYLLFNNKQAFANSRLSSKIQFTMLGLVVLSLLVFSIANSTFFTERFAIQNNLLIREKLNSVKTEVFQNYKKRITLNVNDDKELMDFKLRKWSKVFLTDINFFLPNGTLLATSQPKLYNVGLLSEQMNPVAYFHVIQKNESEFVHLENIGSQFFTSAYVPVYAENNSLLGYLNLQYFEQQDNFENELSSYIITIVNVFILLIVLSVIVSYLVSSWLIQPLQKLRLNFSKVEFGKQNTYIEYESNDEIGALVKEYNKKLDELEVAARKLVQSEKESAWREMAKQVAHEIKNPLTPMKLSLQHLQRTFNPNDPKSGENLQRVSNSLIEQIDTLTNIANAFSNFARLPQANMIELNLTELIKTVAHLFSSDAEINLELSEKIILDADKDLITRVFNNLISNSIQAVSSDKKAIISIQAELIEKQISVSIKDNGCGIKEEQRAHIFEPYFTTKSSGTGLGLAMVKRILENHSATIEIAETSEKGTTMLIVFLIN